MRWKNGWSLEPSGPSWSAKVLPTGNSFGLPATLAFFHFTRGGQPHHGLADMYGGAVVRLLDKGNPTFPIT